MKKYALLVGSGILLTSAAVLAAAVSEFEVASIRSASLPTPDTVRTGQFRAGSKITGARVDFAFVSLADLLPYAFRVKSFQVAAPAWARESRWNILATMPEGGSEALVPEMTRALLEERFKLKVHREKREQPVYELTVLKGGPKMEPASTGDDPATSDVPLPGILPGLPGPGGFGRGPGGPPSPDGRGGDGRGRGGPFIAGAMGGARVSPGANCGMQLEFDKLTMQSLADTLTPMLDKPVIDETGLKGSFKATMNLPMEAMFGMMQNMARTSGFALDGRGGGGRGGRGDFGDGPPPGDAGRGRGPLSGCAPAAFEAGNADSSSNAALFQAVQQLGLKLQPRKAPFDVVVVDNLEKSPTDN